MEDSHSISETPARQAINLFLVSQRQVPAREDVEIASAVLCEDSASLMTLFDSTVALRNLVDGGTETIPLGTSFRRVRAFAASRIEAGDIGTLERLVGGRLSADCERRLRAASEDGALRNHHLATAADHYAADVIGSLSALLALPEDRTVLPVPADFDVASLQELPFLSFLGAETMEAANA
ncbi:hypothetical protein HFN89_03395 [Rhizobium laguerreae]|nr:hypothetical protein [Rhizobium laguerreae]